MNIIRFFPGDALILKKSHPCSSNKFKVARIGSDIKIVCCGCSRELTLPREKLEKMIKSVMHNNETDEN